MYEFEAEALEDQRTDTVECCLYCICIYADQIGVSLPSSCILWLKMYYVRSRIIFMVRSTPTITKTLKPLPTSNRWMHR